MYVTPSTVVALAEATAEVVVVPFTEMEDDALLVEAAEVVIVLFAKV